MSAQAMHGVQGCRLNFHELGRNCPGAQRAPAHSPGEGRVIPMYDYPATTTVHTSFVHPEYAYWVYHWQAIRDCIIGEVEIKRKNERYLPKLEGMEPKEYEAYLDRAVFYNMSQRTLTGLLGTLFRRNPTVNGLPKALNTANISKDNQSLMQFVKMAARELISMGRYGILVDMDQEGVRPPYLAGYITENITDWTVQEIEGRWTVTEVILRELRLARPILNPVSLTPAGRKMPKNTIKDQMETFSMDSAVTRAARRWIAAYRVLRLEDDPDEPGQKIYRQYYHVSSKGDASPEGTPFAVFTPTYRGQPFRYIPFVFMGPYDNTPDIDKSPILDIITMNLSHYKSYAQLEHGRFFTALPVYYCPIPPGQERGGYTIGPSVVWEVEEGQKPGIVEYNGSGLKYLQDACDKKEDQIAALGGRMLQVERVSAGQSNNALRLKEANEQSLLLNIANVLDTSFTSLLRWWAMWQDVLPKLSDRIGMETNKDFMSSSVGAREFRAIQMMYEAGIISVDVVYDFLRRAEVIPDWMSFDEFKMRLSDPESFPNLADVLARQRGAPDAGTEWESEHVLLDPQVVAVRGYDSVAPPGQAPVPGQTAGTEPVTAADTAPPGKGAVDPATGKPVVAPKPRAKPTGKVATQNPHATARTAGGRTDDGTTVADTGTGGTGGVPTVAGKNKAGDKGSGLVGDPDAVDFGSVTV